MTVYVRVKAGEEVSKLVAQLRDSIAEARATLDKIRSLSDLESLKIETWKANAASADEKIEDIKEILLETQA